MTGKVFGLAFISLIAITAFGQSLSSVGGSVKDPSGAVVPVAKITLLNVATGGQRTKISDTQGRYHFSQVQPGTYRITAQATGFTDLIVNNVELLVNSPATVDLSFEKVGTVATSVSVASEATQINTEDASLGNAVGGRVISRIRLSGRISPQVCTGRLPCRTGTRPISARI